MLRAVIIGATAFGMEVVLLPNRQFRRINCAPQVPRDTIIIHCRAVGSTLLTQNASAHIKRQGLQSMKLWALPDDWERRGQIQAAVDRGDVSWDQWLASLDTRPMLQQSDPNAVPLWSSESADAYSGAFNDSSSMSGGSRGSASAGQSGDVSDTYSAQKQKDKKDPVMSFLLQKFNLVKGASNKAKDRKPGDGTAGANRARDRYGEAPSIENLQRFTRLRGSS